MKETALTNPDILTGAILCNTWIMWLGDRWDKEVPCRET